MTGNTAQDQTEVIPTGIRWDDPDRTVPISETVKLLTGLPFATRDWGGMTGTEQLTVPVNWAETYSPVDSRDRKSRRADQRRYKRAKQFYNKTYVLTRAQVGWLVVIWLGTVMAAASGLFAWYVHVTEQVGHVLGG